MSRMFKVALIAVATVVCLSIAIPLVNAAPDAGAAVVVPDPGLDAGGFVRLLYGYVVGGQALPVVAVVLMGLMMVLRRKTSWLVTKVPWFGSRAGGWALLFLLSAIGGAGAAVLAGQGFSLELAASVLMAALGAAAGWEGIKDVVPKNVQGG